MESFQRAQATVPGNGYYDGRTVRTLRDSLVAMLTSVSQASEQGLGHLYHGGM